jgi:hypothetical protein
MSGGGSGSGSGPGSPQEPAPDPSAGPGSGPGVESPAIPVRGPRPAPPPPRDRGGPSPHLEWGRPAGPIPPAPALWRDPVRAAIGIACLVIPIAVVQPTATGSTPFDGPVSADALSGVSDGTLLVFVVTAMAIVTFWRAAAESDHVVIGHLPLILGIGAGLEYGLVVQGAQLAIADWTHRGGSGTLTGALYALGAAVGVLVVGGAILTRRWRRRAAAARSAP